jgi:protocatechuate 3,4-dioxygenase beta subunit
MKMRMRLALALLLVQGVAAQGGQIQQGPRGGQGARGAMAPPEPVNPAEACTVEGMVLKSADGMPLKKARVILRRAEGRPAPVQGTTDADGRFILRDVPPGRYRLFVERNGYARQEYGQRSANRPGSVITLQPRQQMRDVLFRMIPSAAIEGRVFDEDGEPMAMVNVQALRQSYARGQQQLTPAGSASTNDRGEFRIFGLAPGRYYLSAIPSGGMSFIGGGGGGGAVMMIAGDGAGGIAAPQEESYAATYYPGTLDPARASALEVKAGDEALGMDLTLVLQRTYRVRGRVANTVDSRARGETNVFLLPREPGARMFGFMRNRATVNERGEFEIRGVAPGSYTLNAMLFADGQMYSARQPVEVGQADVDDIALMIAPGTDINGVVKVEGNVDLAATPLRITLASPDETFSFGGGGVATVDADGSFRLQNVAAGTYVVRLANAPPDAYLKAGRFGSENVVDGHLTVAAGRASNTLELTVSGNGGKVEGLVLTDENLPYSGGQVVLVPEGFALREHAELYKNGVTDQFGKFTLRGVRPGEYKLFAWDDVEPGSWHDPDFLRLYEPKGVKVKVTEGGVEIKELRVIAAQ